MDIELWSPVDVILSIVMGGVVYFYDNEAEEQVAIDRDEGGYHLLQDVYGEDFADPLALLNGHYDGCQEEKILQVECTSVPEDAVFDYKIMLKAWELSKLNANKDKTWSELVQISKETNND